MSCPMYGIDVLYQGHSFFLGVLPSQKVREGETAKFDGNRLALGMLNLLRNNHEGEYRGQ